MTLPLTKTINDPIIGTQILGYRVGARLGQGSYGTVYRAEKISLIDIAESINSASDLQLLSIVAIKCIERHRLTKSGEDNLVGEIATLKKLSHPNIVRLIDFWWDNSRVYLLTEFCAGGDLASYLMRNGALPEHMLQKVAYQLVEALYYLHTLNIVHLDIKPLNILLTAKVDPDVKLADFGFARNLVAKTKALVGSLLYMYPEMVRDGVVDKKADLWSLGTVLYECVYAIPLFASKTEEELLEKLTSEEPIKLPATPRTSETFRDLLFHLLQRSPRERLTIDSVHTHPFIVAAKAECVSNETRAKPKRPAAPNLGRPMSMPVPSKSSARVDAQTLNVAKEIARLRPDLVDQVAKAVHFVERAIEAESNRDWSNAYQHYTDAVEIALPIYQNFRQDKASSAEIKSSLRQIVDDWLRKGEEAKRHKQDADIKQERKARNPKPPAASKRGTQKTGRSSSK